MTPRTPLVAANWKMNPPPTGWDAPDSPFRPAAGVDVIVFPTFIDIPACTASGLMTGAQYGRPEQDGAFTGDISMKMIADSGCKYVLCGHSERRQHHHETDELIAAEVQSAIDAGLTPILCVGETADERELGQAEERVKQQLIGILQVSKLETVVLAYEPVWAIGTGKTASAQDVQDMHAFIRGLLPASCTEKVRIMYGGSVKPGNAAELFAQEDIDGFLVGGSSLKPVDFGTIVGETV